MSLYTKSYEAHLLEPLIEEDLKTVHKIVDAQLSILFPYYGDKERRSMNIGVVR